MNIKKNGFTLIEILVVIGIIAILAAVVLIAINPSRQFSQANNSQRTSNVNAILNAIGQYMADNHGALPGTITTTATDISKSGIDLCATLIPTYMSALPTDPKSSLNGGSVTDCTTSYDTTYKVSKDANGRVTVTAPNAELSQTISVTR